METEAKYYTPSLEEFFVGFEYEVQNVENAQWGIVKCSPGFAAYDEERWDLEEGRIRVKYLTAGDIENFGFEFQHAQMNMRNKHFFFKPWSNWDGKNKTKVQCYGLQWVPKEHLVIIQTTDDISSTIFVGEIKNASELKKVLQMIGVL